MNEPKQEHSLSLEELGADPQAQAEPISHTQPQPSVPTEPAQPSSPSIPGLPPIPASYAPGTASQPQTQPVVQQVAQPQPAASPQQQKPQPTQAPPSTRVKERKNPWRPIAYGFGGFVLFIVLFNFQLIAQQIGYFLHPPQPAANLTLQDPNATTTSASIVPPESVIIIPKINVSAPVVYADTVADDVVMKDLESGVVHYANTANPGENGNAVIFGHSSNDWWEPGNYKFVFALLNKLAVGDQIQINYSSRKYVYEVTETKEVAPTEVSVLNQTPTPTLTLITCTPPGTSWRRLIVTAKQIQPVPGAKQQPIAQASPTPAKSTASTTKTKATTVKPLPGNAPSISSQVSKFFGGIVAFFTPKPNTNKQPAQPEQPQHLPDVS